MITIRSRKCGKDGFLMLSLRITNKERDNAVALGVYVDEIRWKYIQSQLKQAREAQKRKASIIIDDELASKLLMLMNQLSIQEKAGTLSDKTISETIRTVLRQKETKEIEQAAASAAPAPFVKPTFTEFVAQYIRECETGERLKKKSTKKIKASSLRSYKGFLSQLKEYQRERKRVVDWGDMTLDFYYDFKRYFIEKEYSPNTIARHIKDMKTFLYAARDMHYTTRDDFTSRQWSADKEEVDNIYIPLERLKEMAAFDMSDYAQMKQRAEKFAKDEAERNALVHALQRDVYRRNLTEARDIFVMGCLTGQRVSDYKRISHDMIETIIGNREFLHIVQAKTGKDVYVPFDPMMKTILERYDGRLPKIYDQHLNERIKVVGLLLGWTEPAGLQEHRGLLTYESGKRFCDAIMTHTARRSFATNSYKAGISLSSIMAVTGHSSEEMLKRYLKLGSKEKAMLAAAEFDKLGKAI